MTRRPSDPVPPRASWATIVGPPAVGIAWFMLVYLSAEAACSHGIEGFGKGALRLVVVASTAVAAAVLAGIALRSLSLSRSAVSRGDGDDDGHAMRGFLGSTGLMLCGLFAFFVLLVAAPVLGSALC